MNRVELAVDPRLLFLRKENRFLERVVPIGRFDVVNGIHSFNDSNYRISPFPIATHHPDFTKPVHSDTGNAQVHWIIDQRKRIFAAKILNVNDYMPADHIEMMRTMMDAEKVVLAQIEKNHIEGVSKIVDHFDTLVKSQTHPREFYIAPVLIMEYLGSQNRLSTRLQNEPINLGDSIDYITQLSDIIQKLSTTKVNYKGANFDGILNQDIKPPHIFIVKGKVIIIDFGISNICTAQIENASNFGTVSYMEPEMLLHAEDEHFAKHSLRSETYAMLVTLYEMITTRQLFPYSYNETSMLEYVTNRIQQFELNGEQRMCLYEHHLAQAKELCDFFNRGLQFDHDARYQTPEELVRAYAQTVHGIATK